MTVNFFYLGPNCFDEEQFAWLMGTFLPYFSDWKESIESRTDEPYSQTDKATMVFHGRLIKFDKASFKTLR